MPPILHLSVHQEMLTRTQLLFEFLSIFPFLLHNLVQVCHRITWFPLFRPMLFSPMLLERIVTRKLLLTRRANHRLFRTWLTMLLGHMIVHFLLIISKILTIRARNNPFGTIFSMTRSISSPVFPTTILAFHFLIPVECWHLKKSVIFSVYQN